nr:MAG TPA: hypothetical protein [Caudoviricetes sp.]
MSNIERGEIREKTESGYVVASLDREGIETQPIKALEDKEYTVGERVYFFCFQDGTGKIISNI